MDFKKVTIKLDKERQLKLTLRGWREFENLTGVNLLESRVDDLAPNELYALLWACLIWQDNELQIDDIPALIDNSKSDITELIKSLLECIRIAFPEAKTEQPPLAKDPLNSIGSPSGVSESTPSVSPINNSGTSLPVN